MDDKKYSVYLSYKDRNTEDKFVNSGLSLQEAYDLAKSLMQGSQSPEILYAYYTEDKK